MPTGYAILIPDKILNLFHALPSVFSAETANNLLSRRPISAINPFFGPLASCGKLKFTSGCYSTILVQRLLRSNLKCIPHGAFSSAKTQFNHYFDDTRCCKILGWSFNSLFSRLSRQKSQVAGRKCTGPGGDEGTERAKAAALWLQCCPMGRWFSHFQKSNADLFLSRLWQPSKVFHSSHVFHHCRIELMNLIVLIV